MLEENNVKRLTSDGVITDRMKEVKKNGVAWLALLQLEMLKHKECLPKATCYCRNLLQPKDTTR